MIMALKQVNILTLMGEERGGELSCTASSASQVVQTSETAVTNGYTHTNTGATAVLAAIIPMAEKLLDTAERESRLLCQTEQW